MKTSRTMHKLSRNVAIGKGPRLIGSKFGYGLTEMELQKYFFEQGFNTSRKTWSNYIAEWEFYGLVVHDTANSAYWFSMNPVLKQMAVKSAKEKGIALEAIQVGNMEVSA